jgi:single-strand DNA-binding protein
MAKGTVNKVVLLGRLGKDPDMRYAPSGTALASFSLATNYNTKGQDGNWETKTEWHNVTLFGKTAEIAGEYLKKGSLAYVEGRIQTDSWEDQNGNKRYTTKIIGSEMQLVGGRPDNTQGDAPAQNTAPDTAAKPPQETPPPAPENEDDLPF